MPLASSPSQASLSEANSRSKRRGCSKRVWDQFSKQETPGHRTIFSLRFAICIFLAMCSSFLIGGGVLLTYSLAQVQVRLVYSDISPLANMTNSQRSSVLRGNNITEDQQSGVRDCPDCDVVSQIMMPIEQDMDAPVHIYYILHRFYQNHKRYVRSVSYNQLHGKTLSAGSITDCRPHRYVTGSYNESIDEENGGLLNPCGLTAWSFFNDSFTDFRLLRGNGSEPAGLDEIRIDSSKLVWSTDREYFFSEKPAEYLNTIPEYRGGGTIDGDLNENEHFMHWMRPAAHPNVRKFYGIIHKDLKKGDHLVFDVAHHYNVYDFDGKKELLFTTAGPFGNRNLTFGIVWLVMGVLNGIITFVYIGLGWHQLWNPDRRVEDLQKRWAKGSRNYGRSSRTFKEHSPLDYGGS